MTTPATSDPDEPGVAKTLVMGMIFLSVLGAGMGLTGYALFRLTKEVIPADAGGGQPSADRPPADRPGSSSTTPAQDPPPLSATDAEIQKLIEALGDDDYAVRSKASRALMRMGPNANGPLLRARKHPDAEVRWRVEEIIKARKGGSR